MVIAADTSLEHHIIAYLANKGRATAKEIHDFLELEYGGYSIQGTYRCLKQLQLRGISIKEKKTYSLSVAWLLDLSSMVDKMQDTYLRQSHLHQLLPSTSASHTWTFSNLLTMNDFWSHLLVIMAHHSESEYSLHYSPHTWYLVLHRDHSVQFTNALLQEVDDSYTVVGSRSYLDKMATAISQDSFPHKQYYCALPEEYIEKNRSLHVDVIGDYVLTVKMDEGTTQYIEALYAHTVLPQDISSEDLISIYAHRAKVKMTIRKDPTKAAKYKKKFEQIFGPLEK